MNPIYHFIARQYIIRQNHQNCEQFSMKAIARDVAFLCAHLFGEKYSCFESVFSCSCY